MVVAKPEPKVVVAPEYKRPLVPTLSVPTVRDERYRLLPKVDEAVEKRPLNPMTVVVELYPVLTVNGKEAKLESLLNQESFTDDEAMVFTLPLVPVYAKPWERDERKRSFEMVLEAVEKKPLRPSTVEVET